MVDSDHWGTVAASSEPRGQVGNPIGPDESGTDDAVSSGSKPPKFSNLAALLDEVVDLCFQVERAIVRADPLMQVKRPDVEREWRRVVQTAIQNAEDSIHQARIQTAGLAVGLQGWIDNPGDIEKRIRLFLNASHQFIALQKSAMQDGRPVPRANDTQASPASERLNSMIRETRDELRAMPDRPTNAARAGSEDEAPDSMGDAPEAGPVRHLQTRRAIALAAQYTPPRNKERQAASASGSSETAAKDAAARGPAVRASNAPQPDALRRLAERFRALTIPALGAEMAEFHPDCPGGRNAPFRHDQLRHRLTWYAAPPRVQCALYCSAGQTERAREHTSALNVACLDACAMLCAPVVTVPNAPGVSSWLLYLFTHAEGVQWFKWGTGTVEVEGKPALSGLVRKPVESLPKGGARYAKIDDVASATADLLEKLAGPATAELLAHDGLAREGWMPGPSSSPPGRGNATARSGQAGHRPSTPTALAAEVEALRSRVGSGKPGDEADVLAAVAGGLLQDAFDAGFDAGTVRRREAEVYHDEAAAVGDNPGRWNLFIRWVALAIPDRAAGFPKATEDAEPWLREGLPVFARMLREQADAPVRSDGEADGEDALLAADPQSRALGVLAAHPEWTDAEIARRACVARTSLYRWPRFMAARNAARNAGRAGMTRGFQRDDGSVEAIDDDD